MNPVDLILGGEIVAVVAFLGSVVIVIHAVMGTIRQWDELRRRLRKVESEMRSAGKEIPGKRERIEELKEGLPALRRKYQQVYSFHHALKQAVDAVEQKELEHEAGKDREVRISKR